MGTQQPAVLVLVMTPLGVQFPGLAPGAATNAPGRRDRAHQWQQQDAVGVDDQVVLGAGRPRSTGLGPVWFPL